MSKSKGKHLFLSALLITFAFIIANCGGGGNNDDVPSPDQNPSVTPAILPDETPTQNSEGTVPTVTPTIAPNETPTPTPPPQGDWQIITNPTGIEGTPSFSDVYFVNENTGFITSSSDANIFKTVDGASTFSSATTDYTTNAIHMINGTNGFSGGSSGFIYNTTDGGLNWPFFGTMVSTLADISFPPKGDIGYACGINGNIYAITTSPNSVTKMTSGVPDTLSSLTFPVNSNEGWVCGGSIIRHYINNAWTASDQDYPSGGYNAIYFVDNNNGWAVGDSGVIAHTTDGQNWTAQTNPSTNTLFDVFFLNTLEGWAIGSGGTIIHTANGGTTWIVEGAGLTSNSLTGVHFVSTDNGNVGYVVGNGKTLIKFNGLAE